MRTARCGVWIDNAEAIIIRFDEDGHPEIQRLESGVDPRAKTRGGMQGSRGQIGGASHKKAEHRRLNQFADFMEDVWSNIRTVDEVAILGPGTAKKRLESEIREHHGHPEIVGVEPEQRRTDPQLVARFRELLDVPRPK